MHGKCWNPTQDQPESLLVWCQGPGKRKLRFRFLGNDLPQSICREPIRRPTRECGQPPSFGTLWGCPRCLYLVIFRPVLDDNYSIQTLRRRSVRNVRLRRLFPVHFAWRHLISVRTTPWMCSCLDKSPWNTLPQLMGMMVSRSQRVHRRVTMKLPTVHLCVEKS